MKLERGQDEALDRRLEWGLHAVLGEERAPDVTRAVLARHARAEEPDPADATSAARPLRPWLVAALLLLGVGVVVAVSVVGRQPPAPESGRAPEPEAVTVTSRAGIERLPPATPAVELRNLDDDAVAALVARCPRLQHVRLFASTAYRRADDPPEAVSVTDAALPHLARLGELRRLELIGTDGVEGPGLRHLDGLPLLAELTLSYFDLDDEDLAFLPRLPSLRALDLTLNHGFGRPAPGRTDSEGIAAIGRCAGLQRLSLHGCSQLHADALRRLADLRGLISLDLGGNRGHRGWASPSRQAQAAATAAAVAEARDQFGAGVTDEVIAAWPRLRELSLPGCWRLTAAAGARIRALCPRLVQLDLADCPGVDDRTVADVLQLPKLRRLDLSRCPGVTASVVFALRSTLLTEVVLDETPWLTLEHAETLLRSGKHVRSARRDAPAFAAAMRALAERHAGRLVPRREQVHTLDDVAALPEGLAEIEVRGLGDDAAERLARLPTLRRLAFIRSEGRMPLTDTGLAALARLPHLQALELVGAEAVTSRGLRHLLACRELESLAGSDTTLDDAALELLPAMPALRRLDLTGTRTFGARGLAAVARCAAVRELVLVGCTQLEAADVAGLGRLTSLTKLDLTRAGRAAGDVALQGLRSLAELRELRLAEGAITAAGAPAFASLGRLTTLDLSGNDRLASDGLRWLPASLEVLHLDRCGSLDARVGPLLRERLPALRTLSVAGSAWLDDAGLAALLDLPRLQLLDVKDCAGPTAASLPPVVAARALRQLDASRCPWLSDAAAAELRQQRPDLEVVRRVW
jgi:hypothetical protein